VDVCFVHNHLPFHCPLHKKNNPDPKHAGSELP
jgi:hypothetical protein